MYKYIIVFALCLATVHAHATSWSGTSTTYGNTTYHNFHSNGVTILPAPERRYHDNSAAIAGGLIIGAAVGALIYKCFSNNRPVYQYNYYYNQYTNRYEYIGN